MDDKPDSGWSCRDEPLDALAFDLDEPAKCEFCGTRIRWIHVLTHDEYPEQAAGCCCAARLCYGYDAAGAERVARNRFERLMRFVNLAKWRQSRYNPANICRDVFLDSKRKRRLRATVFMNGGFYRACLASPRSEPPQYDPRRFSTQREAMEACFEMVEQLKGGSNDR